MKFDGEITKMSADWYVGEIDKCKPREKIAIFLNTPGGEIYAGGDMVIATRKAMKERGVKVELELGSCVASMGASLTAAVKASGGTVIAHRNTSVMFHGCYGLALGGADELRDAADSMQVFNDSVKADLAAIGIKDTDEWFAADRQKWLGAPEMLELGLIDKIYEDEADNVQDYRVVADRLAAKLNHQENSMEENPIKAEVETPVENAPEAAPAVEETVETPAPAEEPAQDPAPAAPEAETTEQPSEEPKPVEAAPEAPADEVKAATVAVADFNAMRSEYDKRISDLQKTINGLNEELSARKQAETTLRDELAKAKADLDAARKDVADKSVLEAEIAKLKKNHEDAIAPALAHHDEKPRSVSDIASSRMSAEEKLRALLNK